MSKQNTRFNWNRSLKRNERLKRKHIDNFIGQYGIDIKFFPKTLNDLDKLFGEDPTSSLDSVYDLTVYFDNVDSFNLGNEAFGLGGFTSTYTWSLYIEQQRFTNETEINEPLIGDIVFIPTINKWFEITYVNPRSEFFTHGKLYVYKMEIKEWQYSGEDINVSDDEITLPDDSNYVEPDNDVIDQQEKEEAIIEDFDLLMDEECDDE